MNILDEILERLAGIESILDRGAAPEAATGKRKTKKAETPATDAPELPGGLVVTEVDVQPPPQQEPPSAPVQAAAPVAQPLAAPADNSTVISTIGTHLDMLAPQGTPNRLLLKDISGEWIAAKGLTNASLGYEHISPLVEHCRTQLALHMQKTQPVGGL